MVAIVSFYLYNSYEEKNVKWSYWFGNNIGFLKRENLLLL